MATAAVLSSEDGLHFVIPEGTTSITQPDWRGEGRYSWEEWGVEDKGGGDNGCHSDNVRDHRRSEQFAVQGCSSSALVAIPSSVTSVESCAFARCMTILSGLRRGKKTKTKKRKGNTKDTDDFRTENYENLGGITSTYA